MKTYFELTIDETGRGNLKDEARRFNTITEHFPTLEAVRAFLVEHYGKMPRGRNKVYIDGSDGNAKIIGFLHSFWNRDISHDSKSWYQTDWISVTKNNAEHVML